MPANPKEKQPKEAAEKPERPQLTATISRHVMSVLGQPASLQRVQVRQLWDDHYRVNVVVGTDAATGRVAHSFFLRVDGDGNILTSNPALAKHY